MPSYASMSNTSRGEDGTIIKISLERNKKTEVRRIRGNFNYEEIVGVIRHMWNSAPRHIVIEYTDEDGDVVKIGSEMEWGEAIHQLSERNERVLRLTARRRVRQDVPKKQRIAAASESDSESGDACDVADTVRTATVGQVREAGCATPPASTGDFEVQTNSTTHAEETQTAVESQRAEPEVESTEGSAEHEDTCELLSRLFDCDAEKEMKDMFSKVDFAPVVTRKVDAVAMKVQADVDKVALRHLTVTRTNLWIGNGLYEKAECTLEAAMRVWPEDQILEYNAACCASLRGDVEKAYVLLSQAVLHGYRNVQQLKRDPDLRHLRDHPDFTKLLESARGEQQSVDIADRREELPSVQAEPAPAQPPHRDEQQPVAEETDADKLIAVLPHLSRREADAMLKRFGSLAVAINHCLNTE